MHSGPPSFSYDGSQLVSFLRHQIIMVLIRVDTRWSSVKDATLVLNSDPVARKWTSNWIRLCERRGSTALVGRIWDDITSAVFRSVRLS